MTQGNGEVFPQCPVADDWLRFMQQYTDSSAAQLEQLKDIAASNREIKSQTMAAAIGKDQIPAAMAMVLFKSMGAVIIGLTVLLVGQNFGFIPIAHSTEQAAHG